MYQKYNSLTSHHKITKDGLICRENYSTKQLDSVYTLRKFLNQALHFKLVVVSGIREERYSIEESYFLKIEMLNEERCVW